jgi:hypothetical protein
VTGLVLPGRPLRSHPRISKSFSLSGWPSRKVSSLRGVMHGRRSRLRKHSPRQTGAIPTDFDRFIDDTFYNRTLTREVNGPLSAQEWAFNKSVVGTTIIEAFRRRGNSILITPTPSTGITYAYEYVSLNWCQSAVAVAQSAWAADTDTGILDEELIKLGIIWRFRSAKGLDYSESFRTYEAQLAQAIGRDGGKRTLHIGSPSDINKARKPFIADGSWTV